MVIEDTCRLAVPLHTLAPRRPVRVGTPYRMDTNDVGVLRPSAPELLRTTPTGALAVVQFHLHVIMSHRAVRLATSGRPRQCRQCRARLITARIDVSSSPTAVHIARQ